MLNQKGNFLPILGIIALICIVGGGGYYLGTHKYLLLYKFQTLFSKNEITALPPIPTPTPVPCHAKQNTYLSLDENQADIKSKFMGNQDYPSEMTALCDNELVGLTCLEPYTLTEGGTYRFTKTEINGSSETTTSLQVTQEDILDNINRIKRKLNGKNPNKIRFCTMGAGDLIAEYEVWKDGAKSNDAAYFAQLYAQGGVQEVAAIQNPGVSFFTCDKPLLLTGKDELYIECDGGDQNSTYKSIHKIATNQAPISKIPDSKIIECTSLDNQLAQPQVKCEASSSASIKSSP